MNDKMNHAMDEIDNKYLSEAEGYRRRRRPHLISAIAALLVVIFAFLAIPNKYGEPAPTKPTIQNSIEEVPNPSGILSPDSWQLANLVAAPVYPKMAQRPSQGSDYALEELWSQSVKAQYDQPEGYADNMTIFFQVMSNHFLKAKHDQNTVFSPLNIYMALAMLTEASGGTSRQQLLHVLCADSIEQVRQQAGHIWNAHYQNDSVTTLLLGNSLWLDEAYDFHQDTADLLAANYYASSFRGDLGTDAMDQQLQAWLNANTGGLLQEQAKNMKLDPGTVFALASTVYFSADWENEFLPQNTKEMPFHCANYDLITPFMQQTYTGTYYQGWNFGAVCLEMGGENKMWLILPDKGHSPYDILNGIEYLDLTMNPDAWEKKGKTYKIHLSLPKFDITSEMDLAEDLKIYGITDIFNSKTANFSPLTDTAGLYVGRVNHAARVTVDEEGCLAAAFTVIEAPYGTANPPKQPPEMDFTLDRPFMFVISSRDNLPLFVGNVCEP